MTEIDRAIGLALLGRLRQRGLIGEAAYASACNSRFFDSKNFIDCAVPSENTLAGEEGQRNEHSKNP